MKSVWELAHELKQGGNMDAVVVEAAECVEGFYLSYFLDNLSFELATYYGLLGEEANQQLLKENEDLKKIISNMIKAWREPKQWLNPSKRSVTLKRNTLYKYREQLSEQVAVLAAYDDKLKIYQYILARRISGDDHNLRVSDDALAGEVLNYIFEYEDNVTVNDRLKRVYSELPVRMSRIKFHEWVEKALVGMKGVSVRDLTNYTQYLQETYYPEGVVGYGEVMPDFAAELNSFEILKTDIVASGVAESLENKIKHMQRFLEDSVGLYTYTASVLNNMIAILSVLNEESYKANETTIDAFVSVMTRLYERRNEEDVFDDGLLEVFDSMTVRFNETMLNKGHYDSLSDEVRRGCLDSVVKQEMSQRYDLLASLYILQSNSYFAPVNADPGDLSPVDEKKLIQIKKDLLDYLDEGAKDNSRIEKRARIANLLSVLNVIHQSAQEVHAHILQSLTGCRDDREKQGCYHALRYLLDEE